MSITDTIYFLSLEDITDKIAEYEQKGDNLVARGLYIAADLAGIDIASKIFSNTITNKIRKIRAENNKRIQTRLRG